MIVSRQMIEDYISLIPPSPKVLIDCKKALEDGDLSKAAKISSEDRALVAYLRNIVNKPIFGFTKEIKEPHQIFSALGVVQAKQLVNSYLLSVIAPKKWQMISINESLFTALQGELIFLWNKITESQNCKNHDIIQAITLVPASIIVCEELFKNSRDDVLVIEGKKSVTKDTILKKLTGLSFFDLACMIAKKWEFDKTVISFLRNIPNSHESSSPEIVKYAKFAHMLLFFEFSKPEFLNSGLNSFFDLDSEYVEEIQEEFFKVVGIS